MKNYKASFVMFILLATMIPVFTSANNYTFDVMKGNGRWSEPPVIGAQVLDWGYERIDAAAARAATTGVVQVAVLDTGVDTDHPDLAGVVTWCYDAINRIEGCANVEDTEGHGTHTAGTIGALDNDIGIVGIAAGHVELYILKVLASNGGDWYDLGDAIRVAADGPDGIEGNADDAEVISMSLGGDISSAPELQTYLQDAVDYAIAAGTVVVSSAGNEGDGDIATTEPAWPAMTEGVIAVGATGIVADGSFVQTWTGAEDDVFPTFSNTGDYVDISAPGVYITSLYNDGTTTVMSGTSMACPAIAAVVALIMANNPGISPAAVASILYANAIDIGYDALQQGAGLVDAAASV